MRLKPGSRTSSCILPADQNIPVFFPKPEKALLCRLQDLCTPKFRSFAAGLNLLALKTWGPAQRAQRLLLRLAGALSLRPHPALARVAVKVGPHLTPRRFLAGLTLVPSCALALALLLPFDRGGPGSGAYLAQATPIPQLSMLEGNFTADDSDAVWRYSRKIVPVGFADSVPSLARENPAMAWAGEVAPGPRGSLLALKNESGQGQPVLLTLAGSLSIPKLTDVVLSGPSAPYTGGKESRIATGEQAVETLLAEFRYSSDNASGQLFAMPVDPSAAWQDGGYADDQGLSFLHHTFTAELSPSLYDPETHYGPRCRSDRVELAEWLGRVRENNLAMGLTQVQRASKYSAYVERYSSDYALSPSLVYAIMRIESSFNPNARSVANALGLMQVVPQTAGGEVYTFLTGKRGTPGNDVLFTPEHNIRYGTAYLYLLKNRHFKDVENHISRELCVIAGYNGGPNAVLRTFDRDKDKAIAKINEYTPDELYQKLIKSLPAQETRDYVVKVVDARNKFRHSSLSF